MWRRAEVSCTPTCEAVCACAARGTAHTCSLQSPAQSSRAPCKTIQFAGVRLFFRVVCSYGYTQSDGHISQLTRHSDGLGLSKPLQHDITTRAVITVLTHSTETPSQAQLSASTELLTSLAAHDHTAVETAAGIGCTPPPTLDTEVTTEPSPQHYDSLVTPL